MPPLHHLIGPLQRPRSHRPDPPHRLDRSPASRSQACAPISCGPPGTASRAVRRVRAPSASDGPAWTRAASGTLRPWRRGRSQPVPRIARPVDDGLRATRRVPEEASRSVVEGRPTAAEPAAAIGQATRSLSIGARSAGGVWRRKGAEMQALHRGAPVNRGADGQPPDGAARPAARHRRAARRSIGSGSSVLGGPFTATRRASTPRFDSLEEPAGGDPASRRAWARPRAAPAPCPAPAVLLVAPPAIGDTSASPIAAVTEGSSARLGRCPTPSWRPPNAGARRPRGRRSTASTARA